MTSLYPDHFDRAAQQASNKIHRAVFSFTTHLAITATPIIMRVTANPRGHALIQQPANWNINTLLPIARTIYGKLVYRKRHGAIKSDWWAVGFSFDYLQAQINAFIQGTYQFSPMQQFTFKGDTIRMWSYVDRIILRLFLRILKPTFQHIISPYCYIWRGLMASKTPCGMSKMP